MKSYLEYIKEGKEYHEVIENLFKFIDDNFDDIDIKLVCGEGDLEEKFPDFELYLNSDKDNLLKFKLVTCTEHCVRIEDENGKEYEFEFDGTWKDLELKLCNYISRLTLNTTPIDDIIEFLNTKYIPKLIHEIQKFIKNSYEYQKRLIEKGYIPELKGLKLDPKILQEYPEMKDIKKQTEWS